MSALFIFFSIELLSQPSTNRAKSTPPSVRWWTTMNLCPLPLVQQRWSWKSNRFVLIFVGTDPDCLRPTKWNMLKLYNKNSLKVTLRITVNRLSLLLCFIEDFFFLAPFAAHSFTGELRVHHDLWRHQEDIPWAHVGRVWERKRWRNTADWSVEETGKLIIPCVHHLSWLRICSTLLLVVSCMIMLNVLFKLGKR